MFVVVTGASSGIGKAITEQLARRPGHTICAGVRDRAAWADHPPNVFPAQLDVTIPETITAAVATAEARIRSGEEIALVNNAGVTVFGPLEYVPLESIRSIFEVNLFGAMSVIRSFLPLIRRQGGRIVNIGSMNGRVSLPIIGPYCASKFGLRALTDALRMELAPWRIPVSLIEAGVVSTRMVREAVRGLRGALADETQRRLYGRVYEKMEVMAERLFRTATKPERVAAVVTRAIEARRLRPYYRVGWDAWAALFVDAIVPVRLRDRLIRRLYGFDG